MIERKREKREEREKEERERERERERVHRRAHLLRDDMENLVRSSSR